MGFLLSLCLLFSSGSITTYAAGSTIIDLSTKSPKVGEKITMTVTGSESSTITVKYNSSVLNFTDCNVSGFTTEGNSVTFTGTNGAVTFTAAAAGGSDLIVSSSTLTGSSTHVNVSDGAEAQPAQEAPAEEAPAQEAPAEETPAEPEVAPTEEESDAAEDEVSVISAPAAGSDVVGTGVIGEDYDFLIGDVHYVVSERFSDSEIPAGFEKVKLTIHDKTYNEVTNGTLTLIYLKPADNTQGSGVFYIYDEGTDTVSNFILLGSRDHYIIRMTPPMAFSGLLVEATCTMEDVTFTGFQVSGAANEFYYVYGVDREGTEGWYTFDSSNNTFMRTNTDAFAVFEQLSQAAEEDTEDEAEEEDEKEKKSIKAQITEKLEALSDGDNLRKIIAVLVLILALIIVVFINLTVSRRRREEEEDIFGEDDEEDDDERDYRPARRGSKEEKRSSADEDEEDDEDEDEEEEKPRRGFFFKRKDDDIWAEREEEEEPEVTPKKKANSEPDPAKTKKDVDLMDLNNL